MFHKATKEQAKLRLALAGPTGSGKTYSALQIGQNLVGDGRMAVIDTERGSASKYADIFDFDVTEPTEFHPRECIRAVEAACEAGYTVIVIDSLSAFWSGKGGVLEQVDNEAAKSKSGSTFHAWRKGTPLQNQMVDAILSTNAHVIATMRSKMEHVQEKVNGKTVIRKVGMSPEQRKGIEYEFDVVGDMDGAQMVVSKTRCPTLYDKVFDRPGKEFANALNDWLSDGVEPRVSADEVQEAVDEMKALHVPGKEMAALLEELYQRESFRELTSPELDALVVEARKRVDERAAKAESTTDDEFEAANPASEDPDPQDPPEVIGGAPGAQ